MVDQVLKVEDAGSKHDIAEPLQADPTKFGARVVDVDARRNLADIKRSITDYETRLDYAERLDGNPVYVGKAPNGTATSSPTWTIQKLTYDAANRMTRAQVLTGSWDGRVGLAW